MQEVGSHYLTAVLAEFRRYKQLGEGAMAQVGDEDLFAVLDEEANSIAVIVKHLAGNLRSRWTDFLTTDGEKPDRDRDAEFEIHGDSRATLLEAWERGWATFLGTLESLTPDDLARSVHIRGEPQTVIRAVDRGVAHACYHVGQVVLLAKHFAGPGWRTLSIPRRQSQQFNAEMAGRHGR